MIDVTRGPAPPELTTHGYQHEAVRARLFEDWDGKCYLCEGPLHLGSTQVDHRVMQAWDPERVNDWHNLFPAHGPCNNRRKRSQRSGGLLSPGEGVERRLRQRPEDRPGVGWTYTFTPVEPSDLPAVNTAAELHHLHNGKDLHAADLCDAIKTQLLRVFDAKRKEDTPTLRLLLSRRAPFTALLRAHFPELHAHFD